MERLPACLPLLSERFNRYVQRFEKIQKRTLRATLSHISCSEKKKQKNNEDKHSICVHMRLKYEAIFSGQVRKIERGIAVMPLVFVTTCVNVPEYYYGNIS